MRIVALTLFIAAGASSADAPPGDPFRGKGAEHWVALLGSEKFEERETASKTLIAAGDAAQPALKRAVENPDQEVRLRAQMALAAMASVSLEGEFVRISSQSLNAKGQPSRQPNDSGESTLTIRKGQLFFRQDYGRGVEQAYTFDENTPLQFRNKCTVELSWQSISVTTGYNPDSKHPKLECINTPEGLRLTLSAEDTGGTSFKMIYAPKAELELERAKQPSREPLTPTAEDAEAQSKIK